MLRRTRNALFIVSISLFLITAPLAVFYSLGWRIDWINKAITQPGIMYFKALPRSAQFYLDGKLKGKTDFLFGSIQIENLKPKSYKIEIKKDGYFPWEKALEVKKGLATSAKNIILIPEKNELKPILKTIENVFFSEDKTKLVFKDNLQNISFFEKQETILLKNIAKKAKIESVLFSNEKNSMLLKIGENCYYFDLDKKENTVFSLKKAVPVFLNQDNIYILESESLKKLNILTKNISDPIIEDIKAVLIQNNNIYYLDAFGNIFKTDKNLFQNQKLNDLPITIKKNTIYEIIVKNDDTFLKENNALFQIKEGLLNKISDDVKQVVFSPDSKKLIFSNDKEISVLYLDKKYDQPEKEKGEKTLLIKGERINNVSWITSHYLVFSMNDTINISEIDERDNLNVYNIAEIKSPELFWNKNNLYILSENNLYSIENIIP